MDWKTTMYKLNNGSKETLKNLAKEKGIVLFFYPHANTTFCTLEAKEFEKNLELIESKGYAVVGASRDLISDQQDFVDNCKLTFPLISDTEEILHKGLMVLDQDNDDAAIRSSFILDKELNVKKEMRNVEAVEHIKELIASL
ncbi:peroxiredoxin [Spiroplasma endosymbiont of Panorpa germanica]|uniref:peroxiredoxin n=1 Tax=Spiroplasma endosymbiont of Panorpa germanica TaxID=3066314 RepID=UPI0030D1D9F4